MNKFRLWKIETLWEQERAKNAKHFSPSPPLQLDNLLKNNSNFKLVKKFNFKASVEPVFFGEDRSGESEQEKKFYGLKKQQILFNNKKIIFLIDNHNQALFPFLIIKENFKTPLTVIHLDAHPDNNIFKQAKVEKINWKNIDYYFQQSRISDYLNLAQRGKMIKKIFNLTGEQDFLNFKLPAEKFILNLDIDIFGPEGEFIGDELKIKILAKVWSQAEVVIIATSPGFIKKEVAEKIISIFLTPLDN